MDGTTGTTGTTEDGRVDAAVRAVLARATLLVLATSDAHGEGDVALRNGRAGFVRALDADHLAYPEPGRDAPTASRSNLAERDRLAVLVVDQDPGAAGGPTGVHLNGTARIVPDADLRGRHPDLPAHPGPESACPEWVVVAVGDLYLLEAGDLPAVVPSAAGADRTRPRRRVATTVRTPPAGPARPAGSSRSASPTLAERVRATQLVGVLSLVVLALVGALVAVSLRGPGTSSAVSAPAALSADTPAVPEGPVGPPTLFGRVVEVVDPATVVVDVGSRPTTVAVLGLDARAVPPCATGDAVDFARRTVQGEQVTLVPDPTLPPTPPDAPRRAYVVLASQLSYTDAAIRAGWGVASGATLYRPGFDTAQREAQDADVGMWGPPCERN